MSGGGLDFPGFMGGTPYGGEVQLDGWSDGDLARMIRKEIARNHAWERGESIRERVLP